MLPTRPVCEGLELYENCLGGPENNQPEYIPLPVLRAPDGRTLSRWTLTPEEREAVINGADICLIVFSNAFPPVTLYVSTVNPHHTAEYLRQCFMLDDGMELKMLGETVRRATEELQKADAAFTAKSQQMADKYKTSCPGSSSTSEGQSGQQS